MQLSALLLLSQLVRSFVQLAKRVVDSHHSSLQRLRRLCDCAVVFLFRGLPAGALAAASDGLAVLRAAIGNVRAAVGSPGWPHVSRSNALQADCSARCVGALPAPLLCCVLLAQNLERGLLRAARGSARVRFGTRRGAAGRHARTSRSCSFSCCCSERTASNRSARPALRSEAPSSFTSLEISANAAATWAHEAL